MGKKGKKNKNIDEDDWGEEKGVDDLAAQLGGNSNYYIFKWWDICIDLKKGENANVVEGFHFR